MRAWAETTDSKVLGVWGLRGHLRTHYISPCCGPGSWGDCQGLGQHGGLGTSGPWVGVPAQWGHATPSPVLCPAGATSLWGRAVSGRLSDVLGCHPHRAGAGAGQGRACSRVSLLVPHTAPGGAGAGGWCFGLSAESHPLPLWQWDLSTLSFQRLCTPPRAHVHLRMPPPPSAQLHPRPLTGVLVRLGATGRRPAWPCLLLVRGVGACRSGRAARSRRLVPAGSWLWLRAPCPSL